MILNRLLQLFQRESRAPEADLKQVGQEQDQVLADFGPDRPKPSHPGAWTATLIGAGVLLAGASALAGRMTAPSSCAINRPSVLVTRDGQQWTGMLASLDNAGAFFRKGEETESARFDFESISRIIFFRDRQELLSAGTDSMGFAGALGYFPGTYSVEAGGHIGEMNIYFTPYGSLNASIRFLNWGTKQAENLTSVRVLGNRIDFRRACSGLECRRIGSPYDFHQDYIGYMDPVKREIKGTYSGDHSSGSWLAKRKP